MMNFTELARMPNPILAVFRGKVDETMMSCIDEFHSVSEPSTHMRKI